MCSSTAESIVRLVAATDHGEANPMLMTMVIAIAAGAFLVLTARRLRLPGIVLLLFGGIALGPEGLAIVDPGVLGDGLRVVVSLAVGLILFEGGLTLDLSGYRSAPAMIKRLLTLGVVITWLTTAVAIWLFCDVPRSQAIMAGSLVIVTGPTVIAPLLKRIKVHPRLNSILHWEGVLIDPIGVFVAILCFEWIFSGAGAPGALMNLGLRAGAGLVIGIGGGVLMTVCVRKAIVPVDAINLFSLAGAVVIFGLAEMVRSEAGLLSVTVAGFVFALSGSHRLKQVRAFKADLTDLLIGTLFILLAANLNLDQFRTFGWRGALVVAVVMFVVRPLSIFACSWRLDLSWREKAFLSWVAPRGIVAASMASLVAIALEELGAERARFVETFTYSVIIATIVLQGLSAGPLARMLGVQRPEPVGWMIVGAHAFARRIAAFFKQSGLPVVLVDTNARAVGEARAEGLVAVMGDARETELQEKQLFEEIGNALALTDNEDLNVRVCAKWEEVFGPDHVFRIQGGGGAPAEDDDPEATPGRGVWPSLPRPSVLAGEIRRRETLLLDAKGRAPAVSALTTPLAAVEQSAVTFSPEPRNEDAVDDRSLLLIQRASDHLRRCTRPELVLTLEVADLAELFAALVDAAVTVRHDLPRDAIVADLIERETNFPTALGHGVAVPHAYSPDLDERLCVIARIMNGVDFGAHDGEPVRLVFLVLSPPGDPEGHLATLAAIARRVAPPELRKRFFAAQTPDAVMEIIRER